MGLDQKNNFSVEEIENTLLDIWTGLLGKDDITLDDGFWLIGGDSFKAAILSVRIKAAFDKEVVLEDLFEYYTIRMLAKFISSQGECMDSDVTQVEQKEYYALSSAQKRMYILDQQYDNIDATYHNVGYTKIDGEVDLAKLQEVIDTIVERHEVLRTSFHIIDAEPVQKVHNDIKVKVEYEECENLDIKVAMSEFIQPFDLSKAPLIRVKLIKASVKEYYLLQDLHHIVSDGVTAGLFLKELIYGYNNKELPKLKLTYKDFCENEQQIKASHNVSVEQKEFWKEVFKREIPPLNLDLDYPRPSVKEYAGQRIDYDFGLELSEGINKLSSENGVTLYMVLMTAYFILISKYSGQEDIVIGTSTAGRKLSGTEELLGMFVNTVPLRSQPTGSKTFTEFLNEVKTCILQSFRNQDYQFDELINELGLNRDLSRNPLFDIMFELQNMDMPESETDQLVFNRFQYVGSGAKFDLLFEAVNLSTGVILTIEYCTKLFKKETIDRMAEHYINILKEVLRKPNILLKDIEMMSEAEKNTVIKEFNRTECVYDKSKDIVELFEEKVKLVPDKDAVVCGANRLTYEELDKMSNCLVAELQRNGVVSGDFIGIYTTRSVEMIVAIVGVLKAGGSYIPIDPDYPVSRIDYMLSHSKAKYVVTNISDESKRLLSKVKVIDLSELSAESCTEYKKVKIDAEQSAYVIYTSGSTGKPKGVMVSHRAVHNFEVAMAQKLDLSGVQNILCVTTISFDIFVLESIMPLLQGNKVVVANENQQKDPVLLNQIIVDNNIDLIQTTPSRMELLLSSGMCKDALQQVKVICIGGEAVSVKLLQDLKKLTNARIYNMYGPTETTVWSTIKELTHEEKVNIGKPIANTYTYIVSSIGKIQPVGISGELCVAGDGLSNGYINAPELNEERFVECPANPSMKMYRTGDLVRYNTDGEIEYLGRLDCQVKIRGYRVELDEIKAQLEEINYIGQAVVSAKVDESGYKYLCAYIIAEQKVDFLDVRERLSEVLPGYMIPTRFLQVDEFPKTPNGKIDVSKLNELVIEEQVEEEEVAQNELESQLMAIWKDVLEIKNVGINDDFFKIGGHSMLAIKLEVEMAKQNLIIEYSDVYKYRTIKKLAEFLQK